MPWFICLMLGLIVFVATMRAGFSRRFGLMSAGMAGMMVLAACGVFFWPGRSHAEKMVTQLALPLGAVWLGLLMACAWAVWRRQWSTSLLVGLCWLLLSVAGHSALGGRLVESLEEPYLAIEPLAEGKFDVVCLLGGGTWLDRNGKVKLADSGDRVVVAAELFRNGQCQRIYCTGDDSRHAPNWPTVAEMSAEALQSMGVPRDAILLGGGTNTKTEMVTIREEADRRGWRRIGVVTSAWHMGRAERLAEDASLSIVPLPADFHTGADADLPWPENVQRFSIIPKAEVLATTHHMLKEHLARIVNR